MYDRLVYWKQEKLKKVKMARKHEAKVQEKAYKYKPDVSKSQHSIVLMNNRRASDAENITDRSSSRKKAMASIKGVDMHI